MDNATNQTSRKVGDTIFLVSTSGNRPYFNRGIIVKITPSGQMDVQQGESVTRYRTDGREVGLKHSDWNYYSAGRIDDMPFAEREEYIAREKRSDAAATKFRALAQLSLPTQYWSKDSMLTEVARLEAILAEIRTTVEAI